jgi:TPR repeat protein
MQALDGDAPEEALEVFRRAAAQGHGVAQFHLGMLHMLGDGVPQDTRLGLELLTQAAEQGNGAAQLHLGLFHKAGAPGLEVDEVEARDWLARAADSGEARAMRELAWMLTTGQGGEEDLPRAVALLRAAIDAGDAQSALLLGRYLDAGLGVAEDPAEARLMFQLARDYGLPAGAGYLGFMLDMGRGGPQDLQGAVALYLEAIRGGYAPAGLKLAQLVWSDASTYPDVADALAWCFWAVENVAPADSGLVPPDSCDAMANGLLADTLAEARRRATLLDGTSVTAIVE